MLQVSMVVCFRCLWKDIPRKRLHEIAHPAVRKNCGCVEGERFVPRPLFFVFLGCALDVGGGIVCCG